MENKCCNTNENGIENFNFITSLYCTVILLLCGNFMLNGKFIVFIEKRCYELDGRLMKKGGHLIEVDTY